MQDGPAGVRGCHCGAGQRERGFVQGPVSVILLSYAFLAVAVYDERERGCVRFFLSSIYHNDCKTRTLEALIISYLCDFMSDFLEDERKMVAMIRSFSMLGGFVWDL